MRLVSWLACPASLSRCLAVSLCLAAAVLTGCTRYPQDTPDAVIESARQMVVDGRAHQLHRLIYADGKEMRSFLKRVGDLLGNVQTLGQEINTRYAREVAEIRREAEAAAARGEASSAIGRIFMGEAGLGGRRGRNRQPQGDQAEAFNRAAKEFMADPYGWLERSEGRLTTTMLSDDVAAVLWDGKPIMPPLGLTMRREEGSWYIALPTNLPGVSRLMPRTRDEWSVWESMIGVVDKVVVDLTNDVRTGKAQDLRRLGELAGEKAFIPVMIGALAYSKAMEERGR